MVEEAGNAALGAVRVAVEQGDWRTALDALVAVPVDVDRAEALELRAQAAYGAGDFEVCVQAWEDLHSLQVRLGDPVEAARAAAMIAMYLIPHSLRGSELDYSELEEVSAAVESGTGSIPYSPD